MRQNVLEPYANCHIGNNTLECVTEFAYLGSLLTVDNGCTPEIKRRRINPTSRTLGMLRTLWRIWIWRRGLRC